jgi:CBS domain containing-hemolysin-like protein
VSVVTQWWAVPAVFLASLFLSAYFSGCETGCMSLSRPRLLRNERIDAGRRRRLENLLRRIEDPILTCLIGTNLTNVLGSSVVTVAFTARFGDRGEWYAMALVSTLVILFGEILPKVLYREYPEQLMTLSEPPLRLAMTATAPVRLVLRVYTTLWRRLLPGGAEGAELDRRNLAALLLTNTVPAVDDRRFTTALDRYLRLEAREVSAFAKPLAALVTVGPQSSVGTCLGIATESGYSRLPVRDGDDLPAFIRVRDLLFVERDRHHLPVPRRLWYAPLVIDGRLSPYEVFEEMRAQDRQLAMVAGPRGNLVGMITLEDLIETVVGSIADEFDPPEAAAERSAT